MPSTLRLGWRGPGGCRALFDSPTTLVVSLGGLEDGARLLATAAIEPVSDLQHPRRFVPTDTFPPAECLTAPVSCARVDGRNGPHPISRSLNARM
jgi:hypothetical protein